jgi:hypothetical protein
MTGASIQASGCNVGVGAWVAVEDVLAALASLATDWVSVEVGVDEADGIVAASGVVLGALDWQAVSTARHITSSRIPGRRLIL